jgi:hypothetical protein
MKKINTCPRCKSNLDTGLRFCTKCGAKIDDKKPCQCPDCGIELNDTTKFCTGCGATNSNYKSNSEIEIIPPQKMPEHRKNQPPPEIKKPVKEYSFNDTRSGGNGVRYAVISIFMLIIVAGFWYFLLYDNTGNEASKKNANIVIDQMVNTSEKTAFIDANGELTLTLPLGLFEGEKRLVVSRVLSSEDLRFSNVFDITLEDLHQFDNYLEIVVPLNIEALSAGKKNQAWTYSDTDNLWIPIPTWNDQDGSSARIYTNHLSLFAFGFTEMDQGESIPEKTIGPELPRLGSLSTSEYQQDVMKLLSSPQNINSQARDYSWQVIMPTYDIHPAKNQDRRNHLRNTLLINDPFINPLGEALSSLGENVFSKPENKTKVKETLRNYNNIPPETRESPAIKDVFTALYALDYIENNTGADFNFTSKFGLEEIYRTFSTTLENGNLKSMAQWKHQLSRQIALMQEPTHFGQISDKFFDSQFDDFIKRDNNQEKVKEILRTRGEITGDQIPDQINSSLKSDLSSFLRFYLKPAIEEIKRDYTVQSKIKLQENAEEMRSSFNKRHHIHCKMKLNAVQKTVNYSGSLVVFDVPESLRPKWQGVMNANETLDFYFTTAGYIEAGMPSRVTLYMNQKNEKEIISVDFQIKSGTTEIVFTPDDFKPVLGNKQIDINEELKKQQQELDQIYKQLNRSN